MSPAFEETISESLRTAPERSGPAGLALAPSDVVRLITSGVIALTHRTGGPAVGLIGTGEIEGLQRAAGLSAGLHARLLTAATWREVPISEVPNSAAYGLSIEAAKDACARLDATAMELTCALRHPIEQRLARWLLKIDTLLHGQEIRISQAILAEMLSVKRTSICPTVKKMKAAKAIRSTRQNIKVDRSTLSAFACGCRPNRNPPAIEEISKMSLAADHETEWPGLSWSAEWRHPGQ